MDVISREKALRNAFGRMPGWFIKRPGAGRRFEAVVFYDVCNPTGEKFAPASAPHDGQGMVLLASAAATVEFDHPLFPPPLGLQPVTTQARRKVKQQASRQPKRGRYRAALSQNLKGV